MPALYCGNDSVKHDSFIHVVEPRQMLKINKEVMPFRPTYELEDKQNIKRSGNIAWFLTKQQYQPMQRSH